MSSKIGKLEFKYFWSQLKDQLSNYFYIYLMLLKQFVKISPIVAIVLSLIIVCATQQYQPKLYSRNNICLVSPQNYINLKTRLQLLKRTDNQYKCMNITPLYHQYKDNRFHFQTIYEQFLPWCTQGNSYQHINKNTIYRINKGSTIIPWALTHIQPKDKVLYHMPDIFNPLDYLVISKLIGNQSNLDIVGKDKSCWSMVTQLHSVINSGYIPIDKLDFNNYQVIISNGGAKLFQYLRTMSSRQGILQVILRVSSNDLKELKQLSKKYKVRRIVMNDCSQFDSVAQTSFEEEGDFEIIIKESKWRNEIINKTPSSNKFLNEIEENYTRFKESQAKKLQALIQYSDNKQKCYCPNVGNSNLGKETSKPYSYTIYGSMLYEVSQEQLDLWENQRQHIQWIRSKVKAKNSVYLQLQRNGNSNCIFSSVEISTLLPEGKLYLYINPQFQQLIRITKVQIERNNIKNIIILDQSSTIKALQSNLIITDNIDIISAVSQKLNNGQRSLLAFITKKDKYSIDLIIRLYSKYHIRKVILPQNPISCLGYQYEHFYFTSQNPEGFYEIQTQGYVVYGYWSGDTLNSHRLFNFNEMVATMGVEVKLVSSKLVYQSFQLPSIPIHRAFRLLVAVHRADYFRGYLMSNYGGGYTDIKHVHFNWRPYFERLEKNKETKWAVGYAERSQGDVGCKDEHGEPNCSVIMSNYKNLLGNGQYIHIKNSPIAKEWLSLQHTILDRRYPALVQNPPVAPGYEATGWRMRDPKTQIQFTSKYPISWTEVCGDLFSRAQYKYLGKYYLDFPYSITTDYRN